MLKEMVGSGRPHLHFSLPFTSTQEAQNKVFLAQRAVALSSATGALRPP